MSEQQEPTGVTDPAAWRRFQALPYVLQPRRRVPVDPLAVDRAPDATEPRVHHEPAHGHEVAHQHAFVMVGTSALFLCHLTMLHMEEHAYLLVLRARLPDDAMRAYAEQVKLYPGATFFLGNVAGGEFTIPGLLLGDLLTFRADIWRGIPFAPKYEHWPWDGVAPAMHDVRVRVERVVYARQFDANMAYPLSPSYLLFGEGAEAHLYHCQTKEPDSDHVATLHEAPAWLDDAKLRMGVPVNFPDVPLVRPPRCGKPPIDAGRHHVAYRGVTAGNGRPLLHPLHVRRTLWFSTQITNLADPCPPPDFPQPWHREASPHAPGTGANGAGAGGTGSDHGHHGHHAHARHTDAHHTHARPARTHP